MMAVKRAYDEATAGQQGDVVPVVITVYEDTSFELRYKTPPTSTLVAKALAANGSSGEPGAFPRTARGDRVGTARSMGVRVEED